VFLLVDVKDAAIKCLVKLEEICTYSIGVVNSCHHFS